MPGTLPSRDTTDRLADRIKVLEQRPWMSPDDVRRMIADARRDTIEDVVKTLAFYESERERRRGNVTG